MNPKVIAVDFDGTLAEHPTKYGNYTTKRKIEQKPNKYIVDYISDLKFNKDHKIVIHTSRSWEDYNSIQAWLKKYRLTCIVDDIVCGKFKADIYLDDRALNVEDI